jgi:hypothetical protein
MDEQDWAAIWLSRLNEVELYATAPCDPVVFHRFLPLITFLSAPCHQLNRRQSIPRGNSSDNTDGAHLPLSDTDFQGSGEQ